MFPRRQRLLFLGAVLLCASTLLIQPGTLLAHGGEDHGDEGKQESSQMASSGNVVSLTKESQFLLKVQTSVAKNETVLDSVQALGKITHRATGQQDIFATGSGRFMISSSGKIPIVGQQVRRGEVLGYLEIIGQITLKAPFDGIVSFIGYHPGEWVSAGSKLFTIDDPKIVWVEAQLFEKDLSHITAGSKASVIVENLPDLTFSGKILAIGKTLDEQTRSALVTIEVPNPEGRLRIGQWAKVYIETATSLQAIVIPKSALLIKEGLPIVFVKEAAERFEARIVTINGEFQDEVYITRGVSESEKVVTQGNYQLLPFLKTLGK